MIPLRQGFGGQARTRHGFGGQGRAWIAAIFVAGCAVSASAQNQSPVSTGTPVPPITDEDRAAAFPMDMHGHEMADRAIHFKVLFDQLEWQGAKDVNQFSWDNSTWVGGDRSRVWLRTEGEAAAHKGPPYDVEAEAHVLYGRSFSRWWDVVAGVRQDFSPGPARTWAAIGIQGLAPQWFEIEATAYVGEAGRIAARFQVEYELRLTNRLMAQPLVELNVAGKADPERGLDAGLTSADAGLRVRYEIRREFAPYVGVVWRQSDGVSGWRITTGLRAWF